MAAMLDEAASFVMKTALLKGFILMLLVFIVLTNLQGTFINKIQIEKRKIKNNECEGGDSLLF